MPSTSQEAFVRTYHVTPQLLAASLIFVLTTFTYLDILNHQFVSYDDGRIILARSATFETLSLQNLKNIILDDFPREEPLIIRDLSYLVNGSIFGAQNPQGYLLGNLLLHMVASYLIFALSLLLFPERYWQAILTALLFALHPVHVESVAWISSRKDTLYSCFFLAGLLSYSKFVKTHKTFLLAASLGLYLLALFSKSSAISFVLIVLVYRSLFASEKKWTLREVSYFALLAVVSLLFMQWYSRVLTEFGLFKLQSAPPLFKEDPGLWLLLNVEVITFYLGKLLYPATLSNIYDSPAPLILFRDLPFFILSVATCIVLTFALLKFITMRDRRPLFLLLWFFVILGPYLNWAGINIFVADRYLYLAAFAPLAAASFVLTYSVTTIRNHQKIAGNLAFGLVCLLLSVMTSRGIKAVQVWTDTSTLWRNSVTAAPLHVQPYVGLLNSDFEIYNQHKGTPEGNEALDRAKTLAKQAYRRFCKNGNCSPQATGILLSLAKIAYEENNLQESERLLQKALWLKPEDLHLNYLHAYLAIKKRDYQTARKDIDYIKQNAHPHMDAEILARVDDLAPLLVGKELNTK